MMVPRTPRAKVTIQRWFRSSMAGAGLMSDVYAIRSVSCASGTAHASAE
jgi:hypothetical protein